MKKLKVGDVFTMTSINDENDPKTYFGQIVKIPNKSNFIIAVFKKVCYNQDLPSLDKIIDDDILFLGYTMDALFYHKYWKVVGNSLSNLEKIKLPYYKLGTPPDMSIVNYKGDRIRKADKYEFDNLEYQTVSAPVRFEVALNTYHRMTGWDENDNELLYQKVLEGIAIVEASNL
jgi:hypothetical protein